MNKLKEIFYDNMYEFGFNGLALIAIITLLLYGTVSLITDIIYHVKNSQ